MSLVDKTPYKVVISEIEVVDFDDLEEHIQEEFLGHCIYSPGRNESLLLFHKILNHIYDNDKLDEIFHNDTGIKYTFFFMLEKYGIVKSTSDCWTMKLCTKGIKLLDRLNELYGELERNNG